MNTGSTTQGASAQTDRFVHQRLPSDALLPRLVFEGPGLQFPAQLNLVQTLFARVEAQGLAGRPLLRSSHCTLSYAQAGALVDRIGQVLIDDLALLPGNRVLLRGGNSIGMALVWLAVVKAGLIAVATMPLLRAKELAEVLDKARPVLALCDGRLLAELELARTDGCSLARLLQFDGLDPTRPATDAAAAPDLSLLLAGKSGGFAGCPTAATDIAMLAFTSGTTGRPKAAVHTHRDIMAACETWPRHVLRATPDDIVIGSPPLAFTFGLGGLLIFPMWAGASVYFPDVPYSPATMVRLMHDVGSTICYTAPTFYRQMAPLYAQAAAESGQAWQPRLRICVSAGEGLPDATRTLWRNATGIEMLDGIGATEMFHIFISSAGAEVRHGAIGKVVPGYSARVVDDVGAELPRGSIGRLAVVGPTGCKYLDDPRQAQYVQHGWNYPGDAFTQDSDGYFHYQARADDMIISAGYNIAGPEVEDALLKHPAVAECGVVGQPDEERGMIVKAYCVLRAGRHGDAATVKALQDHVKATLAPFKYPREIVFLDSLPRTETGKLQRFRLRRG